MAGQWRIFMPNMSRHPHHPLLWLVLAGFLLASGCRLDDDTDYAIRTYSSFFLMEKPNGELTLLRYQQDSHLLTESWNTTANVPDPDLSAAEMVENVVWIASGPQRSILQVSPAYGSVQEKFGDLPLAPHHIAVGDKQVLIADTTAHKVAFLRRRNGKVQEIAFQGKPGKCIYNSGKFYLQVDDSLIAIYDEAALSPRNTVSVGLRVDELLLTRYHTIVAMSHDSSTTYRVILDPNADVLIGENAPVFYTKLRPTPYFSVRFGTEFLQDLQLLQGNLTDETGTLLADSILDFEADFFEGTLFYTRGQDWVVKRISGLETLDSLAFQGRFIQAFHQYAAE